MKSASVQSPSPLAELNAYMAQATGTVVGDRPWPDLRSARRFMETWERLEAEQQIQQARQRAPRNAGPLNPQRLMIETLARMGELSPHYLRRFLAHSETLLWLEQAQSAFKLSTAQATGGAAGKSAKAVRGKK